MPEKEESAGNFLRNESDGGHHFSCPPQAQIARHSQEPRSPSTLLVPRAFPPCCPVDPSHPTHLPWRAPGQSNSCRGERGEITPHTSMHSIPAARSLTCLHREQTLPSSVGPQPSQQLTADSQASHQQAHSSCSQASRQYRRQMLPGAPAVNKAGH